MNISSPIHVTVENTATGFSAFADEIPVCTTGSDLEELEHNMHEAIGLYFTVAGVPLLFHLEFQFVE
jgi:predicted RNase H-like HicB family nuclease